MLRHGGNDDIDTELYFDDSFKSYFSDIDIIRIDRKCLLLIRIPASRIIWLLFCT